MTTVRRARLNKIGWEDSLVVETSDEEFTEPDGDQVRLEVEACGVCHRDCIDRSGRFKFIQIPVTPGHEAVDGGAPLLGVAGICLISHGSSVGRTITNAVGLARRLVESGLNQTITSRLSAMQEAIA